MNRGILMDPSALTALSPMDGRYAAIAATFGLRLEYEEIRRLLQSSMDCYR